MARPGASGLTRATSRALRALGVTTVSYSGLVWIYVCLNSISHPATLNLQLTHLSSWPTEGDAGWAAFLLSAATFLCMRIASYRRLSARDRVRRTGGAAGGPRLGPASGRCGAKGCCGWWG